eukprot:10897065-Ditylum_brightwellii.AAC.1
MGKLNYLEKGSKGDISFATHQCTRFVRIQGSHMQHQWNILKKSFSVYVDADFSGNCFKKTAMHDVSTAKSRTGYIITYAGCPILGASELQTLVTLSTTEAEYVALSIAAREAILLMNFLQEIQDQGITKANHTPETYCKMFEDNSGALELD